MDAKKLIKQRDRNRVLQAIAYCAGFPLLIVMVFIGSIPFMGEAAFGVTQYVGVIISIVAWLVVSIFQILITLITKNFSARAVMVVIVTLVVMAGGSVVFDLWAEKEVDNARISYVRDIEGLDEETEVTVDATSYSYQITKGDDKETITGTMPIKNFRNQINAYVPWTNKSGLVDSFNSSIDDFMRVYNVNYEYMCKGNVNTDGSTYGKARTVEDKDGKQVAEYWFGEKADVYKENGLYADGYVFSVPVAMEILIAYYSTQEYYAEKDKDADEELAKALEEVADSKEWKNYIKTDEYKDAYGVNGTASNYMITIERLGTIINALGKGLYEEEIYEMLTTNPAFVGILGGFGINFEELGITEETIMNLSLENIMDIVSGFGLSFTEDDILGLLSGFSSYQVSNVLPQMYFIEDEMLRTYAYAKYFGETHGANVGSVLIPSKTVETDGTVTYGNVGHVTMSTSGVPYAGNGLTLSELYLLRAQCSYIPDLYPLFASRRYSYIFAGIIALCFVIFYYAKLKVYLKGKRLEKNSLLSGGVK